jgi:hypothetical protein
MKTGRSPLKKPPLRNPGESLQERRETLFDDDVFPLLFTSVFTIIIAAYTWLIHFGIVVLAPKTFTVIAAVCVAVSVWKFRQARNQVRLINRGIEAEKSVGQFLEQFRAQGYKVLHDIIVKTGDRTFNIDHILIGPKGVFTVETKSCRKPDKGQCIVTYDGKKILINGQASDRDPIAQASGQAAWVRDHLKSCTALASIPVTPLVVFPGWYIDYLQAGDARVKVANEHLIWSCIQSSPHQLNPHDAMLIESRLTDYIQRQSA